jgi:hypothetical protein
MGVQVLMEAIGVQALLEAIGGQTLMETMGVQASPAESSLNQSLPVAPRFVRMEFGRIRP